LFSEKVREIFPDRKEAAIKYDIGQKFASATKTVRRGTKNEDKGHCDAELPRLMWNKEDKGNSNAELQS
jgi:hypothetical protein